MHESLAWKKFFMFLYILFVYSCGLCVCVWLSVFNVIVCVTTKCGYPSSQRKICIVYMCSIFYFFYEKGKLLWWREPLYFCFLSSFPPHVCVSYTLVCHFLCLHPPSLCPPPALLFSEHAHHPRGEGVLLPFGQLREAVFAPSVCPAKQTAMLLQCGQSLGSTVWQMPPSRNR